MTEYLHFIIHMFLSASPALETLFTLWWHISGIRWPNVYNSTWPMTLWGHIIHVLWTVFSCSGDTIHWMWWCHQWHLTRAVARKDSLTGLFIFVLLIWH